MQSEELSVALNGNIGAGLGGEIEVATAVDLEVVRRGDIVSSVENQPVTLYLGIGYVPAPNFGIAGSYTFLLGRTRN